MAKPGEKRLQILQALAGMLEAPKAGKITTAALAARHRLAIVEDDPYSELYYDGEAPAALHALDSYGQVIYLKTFSKTVFPGLRIGYIVAPQPVIHRVALEKQYDDLHSNNLAQWLLLRFIDDKLESVQYLETDGARITRIHAQRNPDKLARLAQVLGRELSVQP